MTAVTALPETLQSETDEHMARSRRTDGRQHDTGLVKPYRPCPADFREVFLRFGQSKEIEEHYRTNWRVIRRWIEESGGDELRAERFALAGKRTGGKLRTRARRYVLGRTLKGK